MKSSKKSNFNPIRFFVNNPQFTSCLSVLLTCAFLNLIVSCSYYNVKDLTTNSEIISKQLDDFNKSQSYIIMHSGENTWHLNNIVLSEADKTISGNVELLSAIHTPIKPRNSKRIHRYNSSQKPLNEVHITLNTNEVPEKGSNVILPFTKIISISVNDKNTGQTIINAVIGTVGVIAVIFIIIALTKSSCPFVYIKNGEEYKFVGELYPGVLTANQQRDDYLFLPNIESDNNVYNIKITNELKEIQYTDFVQLIIAEHAENQTVLLDKYGIPHVFSEIISPHKVYVDNIKTETTTILGKDNISHLFDSDLQDPTSIREIELEFIKPMHSNNAKLYIVAKNSMWLDYIFGKFNEQFGSHYEEFQKDQQNATKEHSMNWVNEQNIPLTVYMKTDKGWEFVDRINTVGPMASRDIVIPVKIGEVEGDKLQIKLQTGFMFWEVDYVGIDYTEQDPIKLNYIMPDLAIDQNNNNVSKLLSVIDNHYFIQPNVGDKVDVTFKYDSKQPDLKRSVFLKNRGYYNYIRDYTGKANFNKLKLFKESGAFTDFSKYEYQAIMDYSDRFDLTQNDAN